MGTAVGMTPGQGSLALLEQEHAGIQSHLCTLSECASSAFGLCLAGSARDRMMEALTFFREAIPRKVADEERSLFPRLRAIRGEAAREIQSPIESLEADNEDAHRFFAEAAAIAEQWIAQGWLPPERLARFRECVSTLAAIYREHIALEQNVILPLAERVLSPRDRLAIELEMRARRTLRLDGQDN